jgi:phosphohistidine phosphatase
MTTKQLIILRHGKSDWHSGARTDHERPLNDRGRADAERVGRWLSANDYRPDRIACSTATRTRETIDLVSKAADWGRIEIEFDDSLYLAAESTIIDIATDNLREYDRFMIVGHNPGMDYVLLRFCPDVVASRNDKLMTTAAVAVIEFSDSDLADPNLVEFRRPGELD